MLLTQGARLGPYEILAPLGAGGMGEVYRAQDTRLGREVAVKILPDTFAQDTERVARFQREAKLLALLNHPNIAAIYELDESDGRRFLVLELVPGSTLAERLRAGPMEVHEALAICRQIAEALKAAHEKGVIHRDLKPANVKITLAGTVKVLDFGLAKSLAPPEASPGQSSTVSLSETREGTILGTAPYMSPEQARGKEVDKRTDIWSFGCVVYETLAGQPAFAADTVSDTIARILEHEPDWEKLPEITPPSVRVLLRRCLEKDSNRRLHDIADARFEIEDALAAAPKTEARSRRAAWLLIAALFLCAAVLAGWHWWDRLRSVHPGRIDSLAVLPLENLSGEEYFADGMTEALITHLGKIGPLRVISRPAVMKYKGTRKPPSEVAQELNVDAVVVGSVFRAGGQLRITVHLIDAATESQLWSETYEKDLQDVLELQSAVSQAIAAEIRVKLTPPEQAKIRRVNPEAYDLYLRAKFYASDLENQENDEKAIELLQQSVDLDADFAEAHADLALACVIGYFLFAPAERQWEEKAFVSLKKASALNPDLPEAHIARARYLWTPSQNFRHEEAIREFRRALELNNNLDEAHHYLALVYIHVGLLPEAIQECQTALEINRLHAGARYRIGEAHLCDGKSAEAVAVFDRMPPGFNPPFKAYQRAWALLALGSLSEAASSLDEFLLKFPEHNGSLIASTQAMIFATQGDAKEADELIARAQENKGFGHFHDSAYNIACAYALMQKTDQAVDWFQRTVDNGFNCYPLFEKDANLNSLRQDPRFVKMMAKEKQKWQYYKSAFSPPSTWRRLLKTVGLKK